MRPQAACLAGDRLHLHHGPIDLIIGADGAREAAFAAAQARFETVLCELVDELPLLRTPMMPGAPRPSGAIAQRMDAAVRPISDAYVTRMAAVAGSVADEILSAMKPSTLQRAYVNNGGDISVFLGKDQDFKMVMQDHKGQDLGRIAITCDDGIGGIATSGRHGRSHSLGIADSVTVLARTAAKADVAATLIANAVDLPGHPAITRTPAHTLDPDTDLGDMPVVTDCTSLSQAEIARALNAGLTRARALQSAGAIHGAALFLQTHTRLIGDAFTPIEVTTKEKYR